MAGRPQLREERLTQQVIVEAALDVARRGGIEALTTRALAAELQVSAGAMYNHVSGRDALLALAADEVLRRAPELSFDATADPWQLITEHIIGLQDLLDDYPGLDIVVMQRSPHSPVAQQVRADLVALLISSGVTPADARHVLRSVSWLWLGARVSLNGGVQTASDRAHFDRSLRELVDALRNSIVGKA